MNKFVQLLSVLFILGASGFISLAGMASAKSLPELDTWARSPDILFHTIAVPSQVIFTTGLTRPHAFDPEKPTSENGIGPQSFTSPIPTAGDQKLLVLLVDFSDRLGIFTGTAWQQKFFGPNGFADYFKEVSYNQLRYTGDIVGISGGVPKVNDPGVAYIRLPNPLTYYADGQHGFNVSPGQFPKNHGGVVLHALEALDATGFNFAPYANPATNRVENLVVIFAGSTFAATGDSVNSLEATAYTLSDAGNGGPYTSIGGQIFDAYTVCPDQRGNLAGQQGYLGICVHEHGHGLGMPDLYDYSNTTTGNGRFDLMAYGNTYSDRPFHPGPFSKQFYGWITPTIVTSGTSTTTLAPAESGPNFIKIYPNDNPGSPEYFLLENRQPIGFDQDWLGEGLCAGLVVWHIDNNIVQNQTLFFAVNSRPPYPGAPPHPGVVVVEADGDYDMIKPPQNFGECDDTWLVGRTWDANSTPSSNLWDGNSSNITVTIVSQVGNSVTLSIKGITTGTPDLSIAKSLTTSGPSPIKPGEAITYTIVVSNKGDIDAVNVRVFDTLPAEINGSNLDKTVTVTAGQQVAFFIPASVAITAPLDTIITNTAYFSHTSRSGQASVAIRTAIGQTYLPFILKN